MVWWHYQLNGCQFEQTPEEGDRQGNLKCYSWWGRKSWTWLSDWTTTKYMYVIYTYVWVGPYMRCKSWTIKNAEGQRINAFDLWCWRRLPWVPWTSKRSNQSILNETNPEYWLERLMLKLKLQYFSHLIQRANFFLERTLILAKNEGRMKRGWQRMRWLDTHEYTWFWANSGQQWRTEEPGVLPSMRSHRAGHNLGTEQQQLAVLLCELMIFHSGIPWFPSLCLLYV